MVKQLGLAENINRICPIFKIHLPYSEADHVLNIAFNLLAGGPSQIGLGDLCNSIGMVSRMFG